MTKKSTIKHLSQTAQQRLQILTAVIMVHYTLLILGLLALSTSVVAIPTTDATSTAPFTFVW